MHEKIFTRGCFPLQDGATQQYIKSGDLGQHHISLQNVSVQYFRVVLENKIFSQNITVPLKLCSNHAPAQIPTENSQPCVVSYSAPSSSGAPEERHC